MRLLLIEDDAVIARELQMRWAVHGWAVHPCGTLAEADAALDGDGSQRFELIVLDLGLPDGDGLAWLVRLRQLDRITPTLVLTARDRVADRVQGLQSGADDYLVKPFAAEELEHHHRNAALCAGWRLRGFPMRHLVAQRRHLPARHAPLDRMLRCRDRKSVV